MNDNFSLITLDISSDAEPGGIRWQIEVRPLDTLGPEGEEWAVITPIMRCALCSPVRFASFHADKGNAAHLEARQNEALAAAKNALRRVALEALA